MTVHPGRFSAKLDGDFVVFLIGMRVNKPLQVRKWLPVFTAMPRMVRELERDPGSGFLHATQGIGSTGPFLVQYWRSFEHLERYARAADKRHLPAWRRFNQAVRGSGEVGIWHETFRVRAGEYESIYGNMPRIGLAAAGDHAPIGSTSTAAQRVGARPDDVAPVAGY
jgi:Domain of unknown function (DUF4188)